MSVICQYFEHQCKYEAQYGSKTVVLMQIGSFYEIYQFSPNNCATVAQRTDTNGKVWNDEIGKAGELSIVLNSALGNENGNHPHSISNPYKVGFPTIAYEKNLRTLLANDWVVIRIDQEKNGKTVNRYVAEIISPTMQLDGISLTRVTNNILFIYIEYQGYGGQKNIVYDNFLITTGVAVVDTITGENRVAEFYSKHDDEVHALQEIYRFLISHHPREIVIHVSDLPSDPSGDSNDSNCPYIKHLEKVLELRRFDRYTAHINKVIPEYRKLNYQVEFLNKIFNKVDQQQNYFGTVIQQRNDHILADLGLDSMNYGRIAYILLINYCQEHNIALVSKLAKPDLEWLDANKHCILTHNAIVQLDLISKNVHKKSKDIDSLSSVLDHCVTVLGRRNLIHVLQNPMVRPNDINTYYKMVDEMMNINIENEPLYIVLSRMLKELPDIARLQRKLTMKMILPRELSTLLRSYQKILKIYVTVFQVNAPTLHSQMFTEQETTNINSFMQKYLPLFNLENLDSCTLEPGENRTKDFNFRKYPLILGYYPDLDNIYQQLKTCEETLQSIINHLHTFIAKSKGDEISLVNHDKTKKGAVKKQKIGTMMVTTTAKSKIIGSAGYDRQLCGQIVISPLTTSEKIISSQIIDELCSTYDQLRSYLCVSLTSLYNYLINEMVTQYDFYVAIANFIAKIDLIQTYSKVSSKYNYSCPVLIEDDIEDSFLEASELRHPIVERIIEKQYVDNDICIGRHHPKTIVLRGVNSSGKSCLIKSIAIAVIMAQAGCFAPCKLKYKPYTKIITRLNGNDDILGGHSSFEIEMAEMRTILRQSDNRSLVLGDELCRGTEIHSAVGLTASAILKLLEVKASFIFATHMNTILDLPHIREIPSNDLRVCNLSVYYDDLTECLVYNRKLQDGPGGSYYGVAVAKSLGLPSDYIDLATEIVKHLTHDNEVLKTKRSRYNSGVYVDCCILCGKNASETELHTHHILEQHTADQNGMIGSMHMNVKHNLIVFCRSCHNNLHRSNQELEVLDTSKGKIIVTK